MPRGYNSNADEQPIRRDGAPDGRQRRRLPMRPEMPNQFVRGRPDPLRIGRRSQSGLLWASPVSSKCRWSNASVTKPSAADQGFKRPRPLAGRVPAGPDLVALVASVQSEGMGLSSPTFHSQRSAIRLEPFAPGRIQTKVCSPRRTVHSGSANAFDQKPPL